MSDEPQSKLVSLFTGFIEIVADALVAVMTPKLIEKIEEHYEVQEDKLMTVKELAPYMGLSEQKVRDLINGGFLKRAPGISELRVRQSVADAYAR